MRKWNEKYASGLVKSGKIFYIEIVSNSRHFDTG